MAIEKLTHDAISPTSVVVASLEIELPVLSNMDDSALQAIKTITDNASLVLWLTAGGLLATLDPNMAPVLGLSRAVKAEQPSLSFVTLDIDDTTHHTEHSAKKISALLDQSLRGLSDDEFVLHNSILHISRFIADEASNENFEIKKFKDTASVSLANAGHCKLFIQNVGQMETIAFKEMDRLASVPSDHVEIRTKSIGLNAKDLYVLAGKIDTIDATCCLEMTGIVTRTGTSVSRFSPGDRVVAFRPSQFATFETFPEWTCAKLEDDESFTSISTVPLVFATAIYALRDRANLQAEESVLIHSATGGVGIAAIQIAKITGAEIFATVGTREKMDFLIKEFGLDADHIFNSRDADFAEQLLEKTGGRGVDVILNSLVGDLLQESWQICADFGRFVEIGKRDILDAGKLEMSIFSRNVTFTAFDLSALFFSTNVKLQKRWARLLTETLDLLRDRKIKPVEPLQTFSVSEVSEAFRYFSGGNRLGKVAVSFEDEHASINVRWHQITSSTKANCHR